jgi:hypothetical protein
MKKIDQRKLKLNVQTLRMLEADDVARVNGAIQSGLIVCPSNNQCPTASCPSFCDWC